MDLLTRRGHAVLAVGYLLVSVLAGLLAAAGGIALAARGRPGLRDAGRLPVDPDLPDEASEQPTAPRHGGAQ